MVMPRHAAKRDTAERPVIEALERAGFHVWQLDYPCDIACRKDSWAPGMVQLLEVKSRRKKDGSYVKDKRQGAQSKFLEATGCPVVTSPLEALQAVGVWGGEP